MWREGGKDRRGGKEGTILYRGGIREWKKEENTYHFPWYDIEIII